ncbi:hypothetical protein E2C01_037610 [Portunus trituberculatus]|uniref:Uncharacterized protein n=1 Tax=Portunus trituberculatus TaxID=210409 RepID=A0A5B7FBV2_PORTR|nr:hypothetical protein [Portunus trituberculatus]
MILLFSLPLVLIVILKTSSRLVSHYPLDPFHESMYRLVSDPLFLFSVPGLVDP